MWPDLLWIGLLAVAVFMNSDAGVLVACILAAYIVWQTGVMP